MGIYYFAKLTQRVLLKAPLWVTFLLGKTIGLFFYYNSRKRRVAFKNIKMAFPQKSNRQLQAILRKSFDHFGLNIVENLIASRIYRYAIIKGEENIVSPGGIFVGIHAGNWEIALSLFAHKHNLSVLAKHQKNKELERFLTELREKGKIHVCFSLKELIRCLRKQHTIGLVIDQGAEKDALAIEFFSHLVPTPKGAVYLAKKFNKKIYPAFCYREKGFCHVNEIGRPIDPSGKEYHEVLTQLNKIYEEYLKKYPWEYFWYYKRFKHKKDRDIVILSDGKLGHLNQSKALLSLLSEERPLIRSRVIEVKYKDKIRRTLADILALFASKHSLIWGKVLPFLVDKTSWKELDSVYADLVISTGSLIAPLNKLFSSYLGAKSAVILHPNTPLRKFDLAIVPEHDRIQADNVVVIKGALFYPFQLEEKVKNCRQFFNLGEEKKISFFVGGPLMDKREFMKSLKVFIPILKDFSLKKGYKILVSTSRRTPLEAEKYLEEELKDFINTEALVIANRNNYDFVFEGFCALADIIFVSSESISMISEAASFNKSCVCVFLEVEDDKRKVFLESMKDGIIFLRKPYVLEEMKPKISLIFDENKKRVKEAVKNLL